MLRRFSSLLSGFLVLALCGLQLDVHVHSQSGERHGGLSELFQTGSDKLAQQHDCNERVPHLHPRVETARSECFLCRSLRKEGVPALEPLTTLETLDASPFRDVTLLSARALCISTNAQPRAPPLA